MTLAALQRDDKVACGASRGPQQPSPPCRASQQLAPSRVLLGWSLWLVVLSQLREFPSPRQALFMSFLPTLKKNNNLPSMNQENGNSPHWISNKKKAK